ncbi:lisH domain-containing protein ARMC9-like isoform X2 [Phymastichus coffea]|uniref:lisH domain-containing protein ARMC9-like isoform X2 n=1 Tax=Phymastichus coffea TaxID=108790 RepID=UPI00273CE4BA|nr:lisH domain-containing protein ARMC9-like isoform X2 [Phymastichus coffea]
MTQFSMLEEMGNVCKIDNDDPNQFNTTTQKRADSPTIESLTNDVRLTFSTDVRQIFNESRNNESSILEKKHYENESLKNGSIIISEYLSGNYEQFFEVWDNSFSLNIKESMEYKIMTLKLRVHYAILPIRIVQLNQHINYRLSSSQPVNIIFDNAANKYFSDNNEKDSEDESNTFYIDNMKQLEEFLNSYDGRKLIEKLKDSPLIAFFALPYLDSPQEDESVKKIFTIDWLEELISDLDKFIKKQLKDEESTNETESKNCTYEISENSVIETVLTVTDHKSKLTETEGELISCNRLIQSVVKSKEIGDWMTNYHQVDHQNNFCSKNTQTRISSLKTGIGFSMISEPHHVLSLVTPSVFAIPSKQSVLYNDELNMTKTRLFSVLKHYRKLKLRFHKLHEDYQKMNEIAEVLTIALESSVQGKSVDLDMILQSCSEILPNRYKMDIQTDSEDTNTEAKKKSKDIVSSKQRDKHDYTAASCKMLNYGKLKLHLKNGDIKTKLLILVALRQKLTSSEPENCGSIVSSYVDNDLLGLKDESANNDEDTILNYILMPINSTAVVSYVQQTAARLLNALASLNSGRKYLTTGPVVLNVIIKYLNSCNNGIGDVVTLDMLIATLQKMSLRKEQRNFMVEANLVEWLIYHLSNENFRMGTYRLEYTCALLMNLSLQSAARSRAEAIAPLFISILTSLLSSDCVSILPYVNGALQNFLLNNEINEEGKKLHLAKILEYYCVRSGEELRKHFSHTLKVHKREYEANLSDDEFPDEDDEIFDVLEKELEEDNPVKFENEELQGDDLLISHYSFYSLESEKATKYSVTSTQTDNLLHNESRSESSNTSATIIVTSETAPDNSRTETADRKSSTDVRFSVLEV